MSVYRCQLCCISFNTTEDYLYEFLYEKYKCECGRMVCYTCIVESMGYFKCNVCAGIPTMILDPDYNCFCEVCGKFNESGFGIASNKHGLDCYMCSCCINGCYKKNDDGECRCLEILLEGCTVKC